MFATIYQPGESNKITRRKENKSQLCIGKFVCRFLQDENGNVASIEIDCLKPAVGNTNILEEIPGHLEKDIWVFELADVISFPFQAVSVCNNRWEIMEYPLIKQCYEMLKKVDRKNICNNR